MTITLTPEQLQTRNLELRKRNLELKALLEKIQTAAHYVAKDAGSFSHRGSFHNCPDEDCVYVRILTGEEVTNEH